MSPLWNSVVAGLGSCRAGLGFVVVARWMIGLVLLVHVTIALEMPPPEGPGLVWTGLEVLDQEWIGLVSTVRPWCLGTAMWTTGSASLSDGKGEQRRKISLTL